MIVRPLSLRFLRSGTKLENTSLSTGGLRVPVNHKYNYYKHPNIPDCGFSLQRLVIEEKSDVELEIL